jgi:protocatechuate 3,4-dioxygenase beta subunit
MNKYIFILATILISSICNAKVDIDSMVSICSPYPEINDPTSFPKEFNKTNNLARPMDSGFYQAAGEIITVVGRVMDSNCVPVNDAKIYIWQANKAGYVQYPIKTPNDRKHHQKWIDPNFTGTGITNSDNLGRFSFTTVKPGSFTKVTPHIHIKLEHPKLKTLSSKFYFIKEKAARIIDTDPEDNVFFIKDRKAIDQVTAVAGKKPHVYTIDITLDGELEEKRF